MPYAFSHGSIKHLYLMLTTLTGEQSAAALGEIYLGRGCRQGAQAPLNCWLVRSVVVAMWLGLQTWPDSDAPGSVGMNSAR